MNFVVIETKDLVQAEEAMQDLKLGYFESVFTFARDAEDGAGALEALWEEFPESRKRVYYVVFGKQKKRA